MESEINEDLMIMLLYSLPASYENFRVAIESRDTLPSAEALKIKIFEESDVPVQNNSVIRVLATRNHGMTNQKKSDNRLDRGSKEDQKKKKVCYYCKKPGHIRPKCPELSEKEGFKSEKEKGLLNVDSKEMKTKTTPTWHASPDIQEIMTMTFKNPIVRNQRQILDATRQIAQI